MRNGPIPLKYDFVTTHVLLIELFSPLKNKLKKKVSSKIKKKYIIQRYIFHFKYFVDKQIFKNI